MTIFAHLVNSPWASCYSETTVWRHSRRLSCRAKTGRKFSVLSRKRLHCVSPFYFQKQPKHPRKDSACYAPLQPPNWGNISTFSSNWDVCFARADIGSEVGVQHIWHCSDKLNKASSGYHVCVLLSGEFGAIISTVWSLHQQERRTAASVHTTIFCILKLQPEEELEEDATPRMTASCQEWAKHTIWRGMGCYSSDYLISRNLRC